MLDLRDSRENRVREHETGSFPFAAGCVGFSRGCLGTCTNGLRFRVLFIRERWFRTPTRIRVAGRDVRLRFPEEEGVGMTLWTCFMRNTYGLGHEPTRDNATILDIGANVGFFSLAARESLSAMRRFTRMSPIRALCRCFAANTDGLTCAGLS